MVMEQCPECGSGKLAWKNVGRICNQCGLIVDDALFSGSRMVI